MSGFNKKKKVKEKKNIVIMKKEHDAWHRKHRDKDYDGKIDKAHKKCHDEMGLVVEG